MNAVRWLTLCVYVTLLTGALVVPDPWAWLREGPAALDVVRNANDKTLHAGTFAGMGVLLCWATRARAPLWCAAFAACHGAATEIIQHFVPPRTCDFWDWVADVAGACAGILLYLLLFGRTKV